MPHLEVSSLDILRKARELITKPENWTQGAMAKDSKGFHKDPNDFEAVCFCAIGAVERATADLEWSLTSDEVEEAIVALRENIDLKCPVSLFNDTKTHQEVLELFDSTIRKLEESK